MRTKAGDGGRVREPDRQYKRALLYFGIGYSIWLLFGPLWFLGSLAGGMGEETASPAPTFQFAATYFVVFASFLIFVVSQAWFLYIKPNRKPENGGRTLYFLYLVVLLVLLALVDYSVRVGSYIAGSNAYETYSQGTLLYTLDLAFRRINELVSLLALILGPVYVLWLSFRFLRVRRRENDEE